MIFGITPDNTRFVLPHAHDEWEMLCYVEGCGILTVGDTEIPFEPGTIVCQPPNVLHSEFSKTGFRNIFFRTSSFRPPSSGGLVVLNDNGERDFEMLSRLALRHYLMGKEKDLAIVRSSLKMLELLLSFFSEGAQQNPLVGQLESIITNGYLDPAFDLAGAAQKLGYCKDHIRRVFLSATGKTPLERLTELRLQHAESLLLRRSQSHPITIKEAARLSGFSDEYYFSRIYKKHIGYSPRSLLSKTKESNKNDIEHDKDTENT